jgi:hypothetical protein
MAYPQVKFPLKDLAKFAEDSFLNRSNFTISTTTTMFPDLNPTFDAHFHLLSYIFGKKNFGAREGARNKYTHF